MKKDIKVFIVDDSAVTRKMLIEIITKRGLGLKVIGTAPNGKIALSTLKIPKFKPDVVLMDILMPEMDGFETIGHIMDRFPTPTIIVTALSEGEVLTRIKKFGMPFFESGTVEFVKKPNSNKRIEKDRFEKELIKKINSFSRVILTKALTGFDFKSFLQEDKVTSEISLIEIQRELSNKLIIIGASTGGPRAISLLLSKLPYEFPSIIIVQHMPEEMVEVWTSRLQRLYPKLKVKTAENDEFLRPNRVYIAPGGKHCYVTLGKKICIKYGSKVNFVIPSIDITFKSAAPIYKENLLGVILTGMGKDGKNGAMSIRNNGGKVIVEHESTCIIASMPDAVIKAGFADFIVPLHDIPSLLHKNGWF